MCSTHSRQSTNLDDFFGNIKLSQPIIIIGVLHIILKSFFLIHHSAIIKVKQKEYIDEEKIWLKYTVNFPRATLLMIHVAFLILSALTLYKPT